MMWLTATAITILSLSILIFIDRRVKTGTSVLRKVVSILFVVTILLAYIFLHESEITAAIQNGGLNNLLSNLRVGNFEKLVDAKNLIVGKIVLIVATVFLWLFVLLKAMVVGFSLKLNNCDETSMTEARTLEKVTVVFDIATVLNIVVLCGFNAVFALPLIITLIEIGLVSSKLVFSYRKSPCFNALEAK